MVIRHLLSIAILPLTVAVVIPVWIAGQSGIGFSVGRTPIALVLQGSDSTRWSWG